LAARGDGDGEIAERLICGTVGLDPIPGGIPPVAPLRRREPRSVEVVAGLGQPVTALDHPHPIIGPVGLRPGQLGAQMLQPALLVESLGLGRVALRWLRLLPVFALLGGESVTGRLGQALLDRGDRRV
jgi:hypothetical protein